MFHLSTASKVTLGAITLTILTFMYAPLLLVIANSFNASQISGWPISEFSLRWWVLAAETPAIREALVNSLLTALGATVIALVLGTLAALALQRYDFFGKTSINLLIVLPIALPGIITGVALNNTYKNVLEPIGITVGFYGLIIGHATFCVVMVFNNVQARLNRMNPGLEEASADLGAGVGRTFWKVSFPGFRTAFVAGGLLAFALSFDEIVVTIFTAPPGVETLPLWMLNNMARPNQQTLLNVVATVVILASMIPVYLSQRLTRSVGED
ncbi:ABC transporter permease [Nesterenkonia sp. CL21]|uniref:ABC transporter permease n=1 Tax=Nesterenkonia sp. CL21 TaxID=3064894 RepID=UPI0028799521|nr:ABC transporter permease [Nesterenkonia sp. CL21]MDS2173539.1 ABC transporter permease [Nesterenkonia sp. CL21]